MNSIYSNSIIYRNCRVSNLIAMQGGVIRFMNSRDCMPVDVLMERSMARVIALCIKLMKHPTVCLHNRILEHTH